MAQFDMYHSKKEHGYLETLFFSNIPVHNSSREVSFFIALPSNAMEKRYAFIPDPSDTEPDGHCAIDKECYVCLTRTKCHQFEEFSPNYSPEFDRQEEIQKPLHICLDCEEIIQQIIEDHMDELDIPHIISQSI